MHEEYFGWPMVYAFCSPWYTRLKWWLFGEKVVEHAGLVEARWYAYRGTLYMVKYSAL